MNVEYGVAVWVLGALVLAIVFGKFFGSVNLSVGK